MTGTSEDRTVVNEWLAMAKERFTPDHSASYIPVSVSELEAIERLADSEIRATCQKCGGEIEGWICQDCGQAFRENDAGDLIFDHYAVPPAPSADSGVQAVVDGIRDLVAAPDGWVNADLLLSAADLIQALAASTPVGGYTAQELQVLLNGRDDFIVRKGLWSEFVASLPPPPSVSTDKGSLQRQGASVPTEGHDTLAVRYANDERAKAIYDAWADLPGWVPWVERGNSDRQEQARRLR